MKLCFDEKKQYKEYTFKQEFNLLKAETRYNSLILYSFYIKLLSYKSFFKIYV